MMHISTTDGFNYNQYSVFKKLSKKENPNQKKSDVCLKYIDELHRYLEELKDKNPTSLERLVMEKCVRVLSRDDIKNNKLNYSLFHNKTQSLSYLIKNNIKNCEFNGNVPYCLKFLVEGYESNPNIPMTISFIECELLRKLDLLWEADQNDNNLITLKPYPPLTAIVRPSSVPGCLTLIYKNDKNTQNSQEYVRIRITQELLKPYKNLNEVYTNVFKSLDGKPLQLLPAIQNQPFAQMMKLKELKIKLK